MKQLVNIEVQEVKGELVTSSINVSSVLGKRHDHICRDIERKISTNPSLGTLKDWFIISTYKDKKGEARKQYLITKDGFNLLVMSYNGFDDYKIAYIKCFNEMQKKLTEKTNARVDGKPIRKSLTDAIKDSGENERMHGFAYSTYTRLVNNLADVKGKKRDDMTADELKRIADYEALLTTLINMEVGYKNTKEIASNVNTLKIKENKNE